MLAAARVETNTDKQIADALSRDADAAMVGQLLPSFSSAPIGSALRRALGVKLLELTGIEWRGAAELQADLDRPVAMVGVAVPTVIAPVPQPAGGAMPGPPSPQGPPPAVAATPAAAPQ